MRILPLRSINAATTFVTSIRGQATCPIRRAYSFSPAAKQAPARAAGEGHRTTVQPVGQATAVFLQTRVSLVAKSASAAAPHRASTAVSPDYERKSRVPPTMSGQSTSPSPVTRGPRRSLFPRKIGDCTERRPNKSRAVHRLVRREEDCPQFFILSDSHHFGSRNSHCSQDPLQLLEEELRHPQQEDFPLAVSFVKDVIAVVEVIESLRQLETVAR